MAKKNSKRLPKLGRHSSGQARVTLNGKVHYCGLWGTVEAQKVYAELIEKWEANGRLPLEPAATCVQMRKVRGLLDDYADYLDAAGRYTKGGRSTPARKRVRRALDEFAETCGDALATKLSDVMVVKHRDVLEKRQHLTRAGINSKIRLIRAALKWARNRGMLTRAQWLGIAEIEPLTRAECGGRDWKRAKRAVTLDEIEKVAAVAPPQVARMLRVQAAIGCRPGEVTGMTWADISADTVDVDGVACRVYTVAHAKNEHHGRGPTTYCLPPTVVELLGIRAGPGACVFPSPFTGKPYVSGSYRNAVATAARIAGIEPFGPHCIRHGFLTRAANRYGVLAAAAAANHASTQVTAGYLHKNTVDGYRVVVGLLKGDAAAS